MMALPLLLPLTTPELFTEAMAALLVVQKPPVTESVRVMVLPIQTFLKPTIGRTVGGAPTLTLNGATELPQLLVTV